MHSTSFLISTIKTYALGIMLVDCIIGLGLFIAGELFPPVAATMIISAPYASLFGLLASCLIYRGKTGAWFCALIFYAIQIPSYYSGDLRFSHQAGLSFTETIFLEHGILVLNYLGIVGFIATVFILLQGGRK
ncbi:MAG: hypothetical protein K2X63_08160 [Burkholderiaceae bacterium]|nr:hypothetical protein [Burkholderiaceae bacterium]